MRTSLVVLLFFLKTAFSTTCQIDPTAAASCVLNGCLWQSDIWIGCDFPNGTSVDAVLSTSLNATIEVNDFLVLDGMMVGSGSGGPTVVFSGSGGFDIGDDLVLYGLVYINLKGGQDFSCSNISVENGGIFNWKSGLLKSDGRVSISAGGQFIFGRDGNFLLGDTTVDNSGVIFVEDGVNLVVAEFNHSGTLVVEGSALLQSSTQSEISGEVYILSSPEEIFTLDSISISSSFYFNNSGNMWLINQNHFDGVTVFASNAGFFGTIVNNGTFWTETSGTFVLSAVEFQNNGTLEIAGMSSIFLHDNSSLVFGPTSLLRFTSQSVLNIDVQGNCILDGALYYEHDNKQYAWADVFVRSTFDYQPTITFELIKISGTGCVGNFSSVQTNKGNFCSGQISVANVGSSVNIIFDGCCPYGTCYVNLAGAVSTFILFVGVQLLLKISESKYREKLLLLPIYQSFLFAATAHTLIDLACSLARFWSSGMSGWGLISFYLFQVLIRSTMKSFVAFFLMQKQAGRRALKRAALAAVIFSVVVTGISGTSKSLGEQWPLTAIMVAVLIISACNKKNLCGQYLPRFAERRALIIFASLIPMCLVIEFTYNYLLPTHSPAVWWMVVLDVLQVIGYPVILLVTLTADTQYWRSLGTAKPLKKKLHPELEKLLVNTSIIDDPSAEEISDYMIDFSRISSGKTIGHGATAVIKMGTFRPKKGGKQAVAIKEYYGCGMTREEIQPILDEALFTGYSVGLQFFLLVQTFETREHSQDDRSSYQNSRYLFGVGAL
eukprot:TRINITY_DN7794_c0_g1_i2.p1 TRINITY_DN7794_c0_g1~~TRINITY_DN7794_c0_g1_i2.p1  ORF type:complete len:777 (-),score=115.25 TRINITY_DN7794_c0_g1_i2:381-2711(-)